MRLGNTCWLSKKLIKETINIDNKELKALVENLLSYGYIEEYLPDYYQLSIRGKVLSESTIKKIMSTNIANKKIEEVLGRVKRVNKESFYLFNVTSVKLFGGYLQEKENIKHLNFIVELEQKEKDNKEYDKLARERIRESNKNFSNIIQEIYFPSNQVLEYLKSGLHNVVIQRSSDIDF
jgi:hypothetical protein